MATGDAPVPGSAPSAADTAHDDREGNPMTLVERLANGLGNSIEFLANSGILFFLFALLWLAFGVALVWSQGSIDAVWTWIRELPWLLEGVVWLLFLPVMLGMWIWQTSWPVILRILLIVGLAGWTLLVFPKPWK
jgi:hypothetical protein